MFVYSQSTGTYLDLPCSTVSASLVDAWRKWIVSPNTRGKSGSVHCLQSTSVCTCITKSIQLRVFLFFLGWGGGEGGVCFFFTS